MSLKNFLSDKEVRKEFKGVFNKPRIQYNKNILAESQTTNYSLIGVAFDYLVRFHLEYINREISHSRTWVAESSLEYSLLRDFNRELAEEIINDARELHSSYIENGNISEELLEAILKLAQLDYVMRVGVIDDNLGNVDGKDIQDLRNLYDLLIDHNWKATKICLLNPIFNEASLLVRGADADFIIDDMLVDVKTTKVAGLSREGFNQLVGYYALSTLGGVDGYPEECKINKVACYSSRYGDLLVYNIEDIVKEEELTEFKKWFVSKASQKFGKHEDILEKLKY